MATTLEQQVALDETLFPSAQRLRIGRSNFRLPSDIQSKEPTLQVVYDVLRNSPFFRAFLVTADVPEIYMQEFWATAKLHKHSIRFKMDTRKHVLNLEAFREMLHISPRILGQSFAELPFEEEILEFLRFLGHSTQIKTLTDVNVNKLYQPWRSFAVVINKCLTGKSSGIDTRLIGSTMLMLLERQHQNQRRVPEIRKVVLLHPPTTIVAAPRLSAAAKDEGTGSRLGVPDVPSDDSEEDLSWNSSDDEDVGEQTKGRDESEGDKTPESDDDDDQDEAEKVNDDDDNEEEVPKIDEQEVTESDEGEDEATESDRESEDEETMEHEEESFDLIPQTPEDNEDDDNNEEDKGLRIGEEERMQEKEDVEELYHDVDINQGRGLQVSQETEDSHVILTPTQSDAQQ
nr:hypothetical protein [Tanacetum cinerariifolium]